MTRTLPQGHNASRRDRRRSVLFALVSTLSFASCDAPFGFEDGYYGQGGAGTTPGGDSGTSGGGGTCNPNDSSCVPSGREIDCVRYCDEVETNCTGANSVYEDSSTCPKICAVFESANDLRCRQDKADALSNTFPTDRVAECQAAGPGGQTAPIESGCGTLCEAYCTLMAGVCPRTPLTSTARGTGVADGPTASSDPEECLRICNGLSQLPNKDSYNAADGRPPTGDGNTVQCRLWHIGAASVSTKSASTDSIHCEHAAGRVDNCLPSIMP